MPRRLLAIGDIHGCSKALGALITQIDPQPADRIVTLGDYVDRGPDTRGVLDMLIALGERCELIPLLGNHEEMMLMAFEGQTPLDWWLPCGGRETLASYGYTGNLGCVPTAHLAWLRGCRAYYETDHHLFVHANYVADESLDHQPAEALRWQNLEEHFPRRHASGKTAIVGHTAQLSGEVLDAGHLVCLDTYCYGGGWLTAYEVTSRKIWQASASGALRGP